MTFSINDTSDAATRLASHEGKNAVEPDALRDAIDYVTDGSGTAYIFELFVVMGRERYDELSVADTNEMRMRNVLLQLIRATDRKAYEPASYDSALDDARAVVTEWNERHGTIGGDVTDPAKR